MNVLLLRNYNPFSESGASANRFIGLINGLCREGHNVIIGVTGGLVRKDEDRNLKYDENYAVVYLSRANHYNGISGRLNTYFFDYFHFLKAGCSLKKLLKRQYDVVWLTNHGKVLRLYLKYYERFKGKTLIELNEFNDIYKLEPHGNFLQRRVALRDDIVFQKVVGKIDLFAVMTNTLMNYYQKMAKPDAKFMLLPMTVDLSRFENVTNEVNYQRPYIAFTGAMANHKDGVDVLIQAFDKISKKHPEYHLYLAGPWHYDVAGQDELIHKLSLEDRIHRLGVLHRDDIPAFVCNAALLVISRPDSHQAQGGFPTKLGEYLATGNPVCVTKVGEIPNYLEDNISAFMAEPGNVDSFADTMDRVLNDKENAKRVGTNGRHVAEKYFSSMVQSKRLAVFLQYYVECHNGNNNND